jgi:hypothetical protein
VPSSSAQAVPAAGQLRRRLSRDQLFDIGGSVLRLRCWILGQSCQPKGGFAGSTFLPFTENKISIIVDLFYRYL